MLEKYTTQELADKDAEEAKKIVLSVDYYAVCEYLDFLTKKLEHLRQGFI